MRWHCVMFGAFLVALAATGRAGEPIDLHAFDAAQAGPRAQVLVLGSTHLSGMPEDWRPASLQPLLERLRQFAPDVIAIEALSGQDCEVLARHPRIYADAAKQYCHDTTAARAATGLEVPAAIDAAHQALLSWPDEPTPAQRRQLAAWLLAANDRASALVQWWQLAPAERRAGDGLDDALVALLQRSESAADESYQVGARLAATLGHARVHPMDDHGADRIQALAGPGFEEAIGAIWARPEPAVDALRKRDAELSQAGDMLGLYRLHNDPQTLRLAIGFDFGAALRDGAPPYHGPQYVAWWETRNLRMLAHIREAFANRPGARVLVVVGSSHKPYLDAYLKVLHGVDVLDAQRVLD